MYDIAATHDLDPAPDRAAGSFNLPFGFYATVTVYATATWPDGKVTTNASWAIPVADCAAAPTPTTSTTVAPPTTTTIGDGDSDGGTATATATGAATATGTRRRPSTSASQLASRWAVERVGGEPFIHSQGAARDPPPAGLG